MRRGERVSRIYGSAVLFAEAFVLISFHDMRVWQIAAVLLGAGALALPVFALHPTRFFRAAASIIGVASALVWTWLSWPVGTVAWLAIAALVWYTTLPGPDGLTPAQHESRTR